MLQEALLRHGKHEIHLVEDGKEAIQAFQICKYDFVITDYNMPKANGIVVAKAIRSIDDDIPLVIYTGNSDFVAEMIEQYDIPSIIVCCKTEIKDLLQLVKEYQKVMFEMN